MAKWPLGDFNIPSPEMPSSEGERPSSAQKLPPDTGNPYDGTGQLPFRTKRQAAMMWSAKFDEQDEEREEDEGSDDDHVSNSEDADEDDGDESDHDDRRKELVPDSTDSDFEDAPMKKQRLRITDGAEQSVHNEGKVVKRRVRRTWTVLGEFDNFETSQTEALTEILNKAVGD